MSSRSEAGARCGHPRRFCDSQDHRHVVLRPVMTSSRPAGSPRPSMPAGTHRASPFHECAPGEICHYQPRKSRYSRPHFDNGRPTSSEIKDFRNVCPPWARPLLFATGDFGTSLFAAPTYSINWATFEKGVRWRLMFRVPDDGRSRWRGARRGRRPSCHRRGEIGDSGTTISSCGSIAPLLG
jgi:hypothetical protein